MKHLFFLLMLGLNTTVIAQHQVIHLWPGTVPGETAARKEAVVTPDGSNNVTRLTDVTDPVLEVFPAKGNSNGIGVVVCPGGGYSILAINLEGYEIASWLNKLGYTAFVLQYRVPKKKQVPCRMRSVRCASFAVARRSGNSDRRKQVSWDFLQAVA